MGLGLDAADRRGRKPGSIAAVASIGTITAVASTAAIAAVAAITTTAAIAAGARRRRTTAIVAHRPTALRVPVAG